MNETQMTLTGNLVEDPELGSRGVGVGEVEKGDEAAGHPSKFRVASTPRSRDNATGEWKDGDSLS